MIEIIIIIAISFVGFLVAHWLWPEGEQRPTAYREPEPPPSWMPPDVNDPPPAVESQPEPDIPDDYPKWWLELAKLGRVSPLSPEAADLDEWVYEVIQTAYGRFEGRLSPKINLYPLFRNGEYNNIPYNWRSLRFFERLSIILRDAGFAEVKNKRYGLRLTEEGVEQFRADPNRWYP